MARLTAVYKGPGDTFAAAAPYTRTAGEGALIGSLFGVAANDVTSGATGQFIRRGIHNLGKTSAQAYTVGQLLYWDDSTKLVTSTASTNKIVGVAAAAAANPSGFVDVLLNGCSVN